MEGFQCLKASKKHPCNRRFSWWSCKSGGVCGWKGSGFTSSVFYGWLPLCTLEELFCLGFFFAKVLIFLSHLSRLCWNSKDLQPSDVRGNWAPRLRWLLPAGICTTLPGSQCQHVAWSPALSEQHKCLRNHFYLRSRFRFTKKWGSVSQVQVFPFLMFHEEIKKTMSSPAVEVTKALRT